jgi:parvulin-like peptidyl-prolyl isomerase
MSRARLLVLLAVCVAVQCAKKAPEGTAISVNGESIMSEEVGYVAELLRQEAAHFSAQAAMEGMSDEIRKSAARQLVADKVMLQEAKRRGISLEESRFDTLYGQFKHGIGGQAALTRMLTEAGQSEAEFKERAMQGMLVDSLVRVLLADVDSADIAECKEYYDRNMERFRERQKVRTSQIFFEFSDSLAEEKRAEIRRKAEKALADARAGKDFAQLARAYSQGPNAKAGGDIGWFEKGDMKPEIDAAIFSLDENEVSDIVHSDLGLHIFKKTGEKMSAPKHFHEVMESIKTALDLKKKNDVISGVVDSLIGAASIVYVDTSLAP